MSKNDTITAHKISNIIIMDDVLINLGFDINHSKFDCRFCATFGVSYYLANIVALKIAGTTVIPVYLLLALHF